MGLYNIAGMFADNTVSGTEIFELIADDANIELNKLKDLFPSGTPARKLLDTVLAYGKFSLDDDDSLFVLSGQIKVCLDQAISGFLSETEDLPPTNIVRKKALADAANARQIVNATQQIINYACGRETSDVNFAKGQIDATEWNYRELGNWKSTQTQRDVNRVTLIEQERRLKTLQQALNVCSLAAFQSYERATKQFAAIRAQQRQVAKEKGMLDSFKAKIKEFYNKSAANVNGMLNTGNPSVGGGTTIPGTPPAPAPAPAPGVPAPPTEPAPPRYADSGPLEWRDPITGILWRQDCESCDPYIVPEDRNDLPK